MPLPTLTINKMCAICGKIPHVGLNKPHTQQRTKRLIRPNLNRWMGLSICARCRKGFAKPVRVRKINTPVVAETPAA